MSSTNLDIFSNMVSDKLKTFIISPIVDFLNNEKGINITVDELCKVLNMPISKSNYAASSLGEPSNPSSMSSVNNIKKTNFTEQPIQGQCEYKIKRGEYRNLYCGKPTEKGCAYCKQCIKSRKLTPKTSSGPQNRPGVAPSTGSIPNIIDDPDTAVNKLDVVVFDKNRKLYREIINNFIVKNDDDDIAVIGKVLNSSSTNILPLDEEDKQIALSMSLNILEDSKYLENTTKIPDCPGINLEMLNYPEIPNASSF